MKKLYFDDNYKRAQYLARERHESLNYRKGLKGWQVVVLVITIVFIVWLNS